MRVLYLSKALVVAAYRSKLTALARGAEVIAVVPDRWGKQAIEPLDADDGVIELQRCLFHGRNHLHLYPALGELLDRVRPDLVHIDEEPYSAVTFQAARLCARRAIPCLFFAWQNLPGRMPPPFGALRRSVFNSVAGAIAGTPAAARVLQNGGFNRPIAVVPQFGVDPDTFHPDRTVRLRARTSLRFDGDDFVVGFGGRLVPEKGIDVLIRAIAFLPKAHLLIAGDGRERGRLAMLARKLGVAGRVRFCGPVPSTQMPAWLNALDALALPSLSGKHWTEQFGRILVEAMACGVPVIASRSGEIPHVIGDAGILVAEGNVGALRDALNALATDAAARQSLVRAGRARVARQFTQTRIAQDTLEFYREILNPRVA